MTAKKSAKPKPTAKRARKAAPVKRGRGRPAHKPDEASRLVVKAMAGCGAQQWHIARTVKVSENILRKYYRDELDMGLQDANVTNTQNIFNKAQARGAGAVTAAIWWDKTRNHMKETVVQEHAGKVRAFTGQKTEKEAADEFAAFMLAD